MVILQSIAEADFRGWVWGFATPLPNLSDQPPPSPPPIYSKVGVVTKLISVHKQCSRQLIFSGWVWSKVWCGVRKENRPTSSRGRVSYPQEVEGRSEVSTPSLSIGPLVKTTSGNASKAVLSSKSDGPTLPAQLCHNF